MYLYHLDCLNALSIGEVKPYLKWDGMSPAVSRLLNERYPNGVSRFGITYLDNCSQSELLRDQLAEHMLELTRFYEFPEHPSRFCCLFCADEQTIRMWIELRKNDIRPHSTIKVIDAGENYWRLDASWRDMVPVVNGTKAVFGGALKTLTAREYWRGTISEDPRIEYLVPLPTKVIDSIPVSAYW